MRRTRELEILNAITTAAGEVLENPAELEPVLKLLKRATGSAQTLVFQWEEEARRLTFLEAAGDPKPEGLGGEEFDSFETACRRLLGGRWKNRDWKSEWGLNFWRAVPLSSGEKKTGVLLLASGQPFAAPAEALLAQAARQVAAALERMLFFGQEKRRLMQLETLSQVAARIAGFLSLDELLPYVVGLLHDHFGYNQAHVFLLDEENRELVVVAGKGSYQNVQSTVGQRLALGRGINGMVARTGKPFLSNDVTREPAFHYLAELPDTRSELTVPIKVEGKILGTLDVQSSQLNAFSTTDVLSLQIVADQLGIAVTNARLFENSRKQNLRLSILNRWSSQVSSSHERDEVLELIVDSSRKLLSSAQAFLFTFSGPEARLFERGLPPELRERARALASGLGEEKVCGWLEGECRYFDLERYKALPVASGPLLELGLLRFFAAPLVSGGGGLLALLLISAENTHETPENFLRLVQAFAHQSATALESASLIRELIESEAKFTDLYENAPDMYQTLDSSGVVLACNRTEEKMLGTPKDIIVGRVFSDWVHPDSVSIWSAHIEAVAGSMDEASCLVPLVLPSGEILEADAHSRRVGGRDGKILIRSVLRDVTEKKELERQLLHSQKIESIGTLAAGVAHEFNNLLGGIMGRASLALEAGQPEPMRKSLLKIEEITEEARRMVQSLLTFSKNVGEKTWISVEMGRVLDEAARLVEPELRQKLITLTRQGEKTPPIFGHFDQLVQVFLNLFLNAAQAIEGEGKIEVSTALEEGVVTVAVEDTGGGIPAENLAKIFDPFFSTKGVYGDTRHAGAGLGLTVCYNIVKSHGGEISVTSEAGAGARFFVSFPLPKNVTNPLFPPKVFSSKA